MLRRLGALLYDSLLLLGVWIVSLLLIRPLMTTETIPPHWVQLVVVGETVGYYVYSWLKSGQTLGMRAWRLKLVDVDGQPVDIRSCAIRLLVGPLSLAALGVGFLWVLGEARQTWHDRASKTYVVQLPEASGS